MEKYIQVIDMWNFSTRIVHIVKQEFKGKCTDLGDHHRSGFCKVLVIDRMGFLDALTGLNTVDNNYD